MTIEFHIVQKELSQMMSSVLKEWFLKIKVHFRVNVVFVLQLNFTLHEVTESFDFNNDQPSHRHPPEVCG